MGVKEYLEASIAHLKEENRDDENQMALNASGKAYPNNPVMARMHAEHMNPILAARIEQRTRVLTHMEETLAQFVDNPAGMTRVGDERSSTSVRRRW